jgi:hypothetical protein
VGVNEYKKIINGLFSEMQAVIGGSTSSSVIMRNLEWFGHVPHVL